VARRVELDNVEAMLVAPLPNRNAAVPSQRPSCFVAVAPAASARAARVGDDSTVERPTHGGDRLGSDARQCRFGARFDDLRPWLHQETRLVTAQIACESSSSSSSSLLIAEWCSADVINGSLIADHGSSSRFNLPCRLWCTLNRSGWLKADVQQALPVGNSPQIFPVAAVLHNRHRRRLPGNKVPWWSLGSTSC